MMRIAIAGASGRMGRMLIEAVSQSTDLQLTVALDITGAPMLGQDACAFLGKSSGVLITDQLSAIKGADCLIDFTRPEGSLHHLAACVEH
jgi:4-hydroxy-tetrahydrodipicolinate reductase